MLTFAVSFTNFGPYHLARLRALALRLARHGGRLIAYETAGTQALYPWKTRREGEPFDWVTLFPNRVLEDLSRSECTSAMREALDHDRPDVLAAVGYVRPEGLAMLSWGDAERRPVVLMSESQAIDHPRVWWKETIKRRRVRRFSSALVGGPKHRDYLISLGMPADRIAMGYNAVDGEAFATAANQSRRAPNAREGLPTRPYFLAVNRFAPEKNVPRLIQAFARYREHVGEPNAWDLVLCGGGPDEALIGRVIEQFGLGAAIHRPGFLQADALPRWYGHASTFVLASLSEPWGLVVNEAAACGLPLLVSERAGCVDTFVPKEGEATGFRLPPEDVDAMAAALAAMAILPADDRERMGRRSAEIAAAWGPERFAQGAWEAIETALARGPVRSSRRRAFSHG